MLQRTTSLVLAILLLLSTVTMIFTSNVKAMNDEQNLSGLIWMSDGSTPPSQTGFAIWVEYTGNWSRFPVSGWYLTSDVVDQEVWYSLVLEDEWYGIKWGDGAVYSVEVDGSVWGEISGNTTSNGTGSQGDPFPTPYDPTNPANSYNSINYTAGPPGGGIHNEQQWDVRTIASRDLIPTNVTVDGLNPEDYPLGIPVGGGNTVAIHVNATSIALIGTGGKFNMSAWECDLGGQPFDINSPIAEFLNLGPLNGYGNVSGNGYDTGEFIFNWTAPTQPGDYYINITVDSGLNIMEVNETNNTIILHFVVGPDIIPIDVTVDGIGYPDWPQISPIILPAPGQWINIKINITNVGATSTGSLPFNVTFYNVSTTGGYQQIDTPFYESGPVFSNLDVGVILAGGEAYWYAPSPGEFRINLTVDFGQDVAELNENNNTYVLRVLVGPDVIPTNVTAEGLLLTTSPSSPIPVGSGQTVAIGVNATNIGFSPTGRVTWVGFYNSTMDGDMLSQPYYNTSVPELNASSDPGNTSFVSGGYWYTPSTPGTYYVTIYVDIANDTYEFNESNNHFVICFIVGPDLTYTNVTVNGNVANLTDPNEVWFVGSGTTIMIGTNATNVGASPTGSGFSVSFTNCTSAGENIDPPFATFFWSTSLFILENTTAFISSFIVPNFVGDLYVNITIDYLNDVPESVETNNTYILHFRIAPDYVPHNVTVNGQFAHDESLIWNVTPEVPVIIRVNCTNIGVSDVNDTITYTISFYNSSAARTMGEEFDNVSLLPGLPIGGDSGQQIGIWVPPNQPGDYYVLIVVDSANTTWEIDENNNTFLLHFVVGPDLIPTNVRVNGDPAQTQSQIWYVGPKEIVTIGANATNVGFSGTGLAFNMSLYNVSISGSMIIGDSNPFNITINALDAGEDSGHRIWLWQVPFLAGEYYVNITVDYGNISWESNELNNNFTLHFVVAPDLIPNNVTVDSIPITSYPLETVIVYPGQIIMIGANASNVGPSSTGILQFNMTFWNSTASGQTFGGFLYDSGLIGPLEAGGFSSDHYVLWIAPNPDKPTDYYINITVDSSQAVSEWVETNNTYIIHIRVDAPDLTPDKIEVEAANGSISIIYDEPSTLPIPFVSEEIFVPFGSDVNITFTVANIGGIDQINGTNVTAYNISGIAGVPIDDPFFESSPTAVFLVSGGFISLNIIWPNPGVMGLYYFNISIDFNGTMDIGGRIIELNESNNTFTFIINVTSLPITTLHAGEPKFQPGVYWYVNSSTELNFTVTGQNPPFYTWYRIINMTNGSDAKGWSNYTEEGANFTMIWGEGTFLIEYNSTDAIGGTESTKSRIIIVDDSPPITGITIGNPQYKANISDILNVTSSTPFDLNSVDLPFGTSSAGPGILNASGINGVPVSGMFFRIWSVDQDDWVIDWTEYTASFYLMGNDGYYIIYYNSTDNLGQEEPSNNVTVYLDNTGPITNITVGDPKYPHPIQDWFVKSTTPFTLTAFEAIGSGANLSTIQFRITYVGTGASSGWQYGTTFDIASWLTQADGEYTIQFRTLDYLDNVGQIGAITVVVDDTPPEVNLVIGLPRYRASGPHQWNITSFTELDFVEDDGSGCGVNYTEWRIYNATNSSIWYTYGFSSFNLTSTWLKLQDGNYTIEFRSYDYLGNYQIFNEPIYLDNTPPISTITIGDPKYPFAPIFNITSNTPINLTASDGPGCGVASIYYRIYNNSGLVLDWTEYPLGATSFELSGYDDGIYTINFYSMDLLGNLESINNYTLFLDNTPPETVIEVGEPKYPLNVTDFWNVTVNTRFNLSSTDGNGCGVWFIYYKLRHYEDPRDWNLILPKTYNGSYFIMLGPEGSYTIRYWAVDYLFNEESYHEIHVVVDNTPPTTFITFGDPQYRINETADTLNITDETPINLTSIDGGVVPVGVKFIEYVIDDDDNLSNGNLTGIIIYDGIFNLDGLGDGDYVIHFGAVDLLDNIEPMKSIMIIVDSTPPESELGVLGTNHSKPSFNNTWWVLPETEITINTQDTGMFAVGLNFTEYRIRMGSGNWGPWMNFTGGYLEIDFDIDGEYTLEFRGVDLLKNTEQTKNVIIIVDDTPPQTEITAVGLFEPIDGTNRREIDFDTVFTLSSVDHGGGQRPSGVYTIWLRIDSNQNTDWVQYTGPFSLDTFGNHSIDYKSVDNLTNEEIYHRLLVYIEGDIAPPLPPLLTCRVIEDNIQLEWVPSPDEESQDIDHYLIYRSTSKTGFNFSTAWVDTHDSVLGVDPGDQQVIPLRTTWNDTGAVSGSEHYYYAMRGVDGRGNIGYTSNIAAKVTMTYSKGYNDFSLPLELFEEVSASEILSWEVFADPSNTLYRYDISIQQWMGHPKFLPDSIDDFTLEFGQGYMLYIAENEVEITFTGSTGTALRYIGGVGSEDVFREGLSVSLQNNDVELAWESAGGAVTGYAIYRATARFGDESLTNYTIDPVHTESVGTTSWTDENADGDEYYYLVVAESHGEEQSSTYAVGVMRYTFEPGYTVFSLELQPQVPQTLGGIASEMFTSDTNTLFYYDKTVGTWLGHPKFVPENINDVEVTLGDAYIAYVNEDVSLTLPGT